MKNRIEELDQNKNTAAVLQALYQCGKMGSESSTSILKYVKDNDMKSDMTEILDGYQRISASSSKRLMQMGITPENTDIMTRMGSKIGMTVNTMIDSSSSHLAEMVIQGANMGITDLQGTINKYRDRSCESSAYGSLEDGIRFNQSVVEKMKKYL